MKIKVLVFVLAILLVISTGSVLIFINRSFPSTSGIIKLHGVHSDVEISRDSWGVPYIYASNEDDLFFAQGYVQAQDRLWQMELYRRMGSGNLSEIFGETTLNMDKFIRTIGLRRYAGESCRLMDEHLRNILISYSKGINEFIRMNSDSLPLEFTVLGFKPTEWEPMDSITIANLIAWNLGKNWEVELLRGRLLQKLGVDWTNRLLAAYPENAPQIIPPELMSRPLGDEVAYKLHIMSEMAGSNSWVIDGSKSVTGKPILANDPHLSVMMPSIWYEMGLHAGEFNVAGACIPGCPLIIIGRNNRISWGITNLPADTQDLFIEKVDPSNKLRYEYKGCWMDMECIDEQIPVRGRSSPEHLKIRITVHGPLLNDVIEGLEQPLALQWIGSCHSNLLKSVYLLDEASNWIEFREALRYWDVPSQNIIYADKDGNIGYQSTGLIPVRRGGMGLTPSPGWSGEYDWIGFIPYEELPSVFNPAQHFIVTANNRVSSDNSTHFIAYDWSPPFRAQRIEDLIRSKEKMSVEDFEQFQSDTFDIPASLIVPYFVNVKMDTEIAKNAQEILKKWDYFDRAESPAPAIFHLAYVKLLKNTLVNKLGDKLYRDYVRAMGGSGDVHVIFMLDILKDNAEEWFYDTQCGDGRTSDSVIKRSFDEAINELCHRFGSDPMKWKWGDLHETCFEHPLGRIPALGPVFNRGPVPTDGSRYTVNVAAFDYDEPFKVTAIPSYRQIIDWGRPDISLSMHSTGQSGMAFSRHYSDMIQSWLKVKYHYLYNQKSIVEQNSKEKLILQPLK